MKRTIKTISLLLVLAMISNLAPSAFAASTCAHEHSFHHEPTLPTCNEDGNSLEYWECLDCGKRYKNETMTRTLLTAEWEKGYLPSYGAIDEDRDGICDDCGKAVPIFEKVTSEDEITDNGKYILVAENEGSSYVLTKNLYIEGSTDDYDLTDNLLGMPAVADKITTYDNYIYFEDANDNEALLLTLRENTYEGWYNFAYPFENEFRYLNGDYTQTSNLVTTQYITASPLKPVINKDGSVKLLWMYEETSYPANFKAVHETYTNGVLDDIDADLISFVFKDYYTNTNRFIENRTRILKNYLYATNEYYKNVISNDHTDRIGSAYSYDYDEVPVYLYKLIEGGVRNNIRYALRNNRTEVNYEIITNLDTDLETAMAENSVKGVSNALSQDAIDYYVDLLAGDRDDIILNVSADLTVSDYERDKKVTFAVNPYIFNIAYPDNKVTIEDAFFTGAIMPVTLYTCGVKPVQVIHEKQDGTKEYFYPENSAAAQRGKNTFTLNETENGEYYVTIGLTEFSDITIHSEEQEEETVVTETPTAEPTAEPTVEPTEEPTAAPTETPTVKPTEVPTPEPTEEPTPVPTKEPTPTPTAEPTAAPTAIPTEAPTPVPTETPEPKHTVTALPSVNGTFTVSVTGEVATGTAITITPVANNGYEIDTVYVNTNDNVIELNKINGEYNYTVTGNTTIEVTFKEIPPVIYTVRFDSNSLSDNPNTATAEENTVIDLTADEYQLTNNDYNFEGWYADVDYLEKADDNYVVTANATLYAKWSIKIYTVTWINGDTTIGNTTVETGTSVAYNGEPVKDEDDEYTYEFAGWALTDGGEILNDIPVTTSDAEYYAVFNAIKKAPPKTYLTLLAPYADTLQIEYNNIGNGNIALTVTANGNETIPENLKGYLAVYENNALVIVTQIDFINGDADVVIPETEYKLFVWDNMKPVTTVITEFPV